MLYHFQQTCYDKSDKVLSMIQYSAWNGTAGSCQQPDLVKNLHYNRAALSPSPPPSISHSHSLTQNVSQPLIHVTTASKRRAVLSSFLRRCCVVFCFCFAVLLFKPLSNRPSEQLLKVFVFLVTQNLVRFQISLTKSVR